MLVSRFLFLIFLSWAYFQSFADLAFGEAPPPERASKVTSESHEEVNPNSPQVQASPKGPTSEETKKLEKPTNQDPTLSPDKNTANNLQIKQRAPSECDEIQSLDDRLIETPPPKLKQLGVTN